MNPLDKYSLIVAGAGLLIQVLWVGYFFGFFLGSFKEFKVNTEKSLERLEAPYFNDVTVVRRDSVIAQDPQPVHRSKR
jgi:hypothetical protein